MKKRSVWFLRLFMLVSGFAFLALQLSALKSAMHLHEQGIRTTGKVIALLRISHAPKAGTSFWYSVSIDGREIEVSQRSQLTVGQSYSVTHSPILTADLVFAPPHASLFELYRLRLSDGWLGWMALALFPVMTCFGFWSAWRGFASHPRRH